MSTEKKHIKFLVTGASGFLGSHLMQNLTSPEMNNVPVVGLYNTNQSPVSKHPYRVCDITNQKELLQTLKKEKPHIIVHLAAISDTSYCHHHPIESRKVNVDATNYLVEYCRGEEVALMFASSDLVFDGTKGNYREEDAVNPIMEYGEQKVQAEELVLSLGKLGMVCRLSMMYGIVQRHHNNFTAHMIKQLLNGKKVELFTDEYRCMAAGRSVAVAMLMLCYNPYSGICHVAGPDRLSRYEFGCIVADKLHLDKTLIQPSLSKALQTIIKRPLDVSLNCDKLKTYLGSKLLSVHQADNLLLNAAKHI